MMSQFLHLRTAKFPVLEGEVTELANPGTYGKAFAQYLQDSLARSGYDAPFVCCEDWGWWVEVRLPAKRIGLLCYREHDENTECAFLCTTSLDRDRVWSWKKFRFIDMCEERQRLEKCLTCIFEDDTDIEFLGTTDDFPFDTTSDYF